MWTAPLVRGVRQENPDAVRLWGTQNPHFFEGTRTAKEAVAVLAEPHSPLKAVAE